MRILFFWLLPILLIACASPETSRSRGGGAGADVGNRSGATVRMHEGSDPYANTPKIIRTQNPPLTGALQADRLSRQ